MNFNTTNKHTHMNTMTNESQVSFFVNLNENEYKSSIGFSVVSV